jgi:hypothetical protein
VLLAARVRTPINTIIVKKGDLEGGDQSSVKYDGSSRLDLQIRHSRNAQHSQR